MATELDSTTRVPTNLERSQDKNEHLIANFSKGRGNIRVPGVKVETSVLKESIHFPFSNRVAFNRFLKAPMTERLCKWPKNHQEDIVFETTNRFM